MRSVILISVVILCCVCCSCHAESSYDETIVTYEGTTLIHYGSLISTDEYIIEDGTTIIADEAFADNEFLERVIMPDSVVLIGQEAFFYASIEEIKLSASLLMIESDAFQACGNLKRIDLPDSLRFIGRGAFVLSSLEEIVIPGNVEYIGNEAFNAWSLTKVTFMPEYLEYYGDFLFDDEQSITFEFPEYCSYKEDILDQYGTPSEPVITR